MSQGIAQMLKPILDPNNRMDEESFHGLIRKLAHGIEFGFLGLCCGGVMWTVFDMKRRLHIASSVLVPLMVATTDEFLQIFSNRGSDVRDVVIDFGGAALGLILISAVELLIRKLKNNNKKPMSE